MSVAQTDGVTWTRFAPSGVTYGVVLESGKFFAKDRSLKAGPSPLVGIDTKTYHATKMPDKLPSPIVVKAPASPSHSHPAATPRTRQVVAPSTPAAPPRKPVPFKVAKAMHATKS